MIPTVPKQYTPESDEDKIFYALKNLTGDPIDKKNDYYVFHSFKINQINDENQALERHETDFVIFHPSKGLLCIECKSGPSGKLMVQNGAWHRAKIIKDEKLKTEILKSTGKMQHGGPFNQAEDRMNDMVRLVGKQKMYLHGNANEKFKDHCKITYAVCFPKIAEADEEYKIENKIEKETVIEEVKFKDFLGAAEPKELVIYGKDLKSTELLKQKIDKIYDYKMTDGKGNFIETGNNGDRLHDEDIQNLFDRVLCPNFNIVETVDPNTGENKYVQLNEDQIRVLDILMTKKEMAVSGMAGTGKTILALQLARKKILAGENVLFLCRSSYQRQELEKNRLNDNIEFRDIDWLVETYNKVTTVGEGLKSEPNIYLTLCERIIDEKLSAGELKLVKHGKRPSYKIQTILVDEAQDFCKDEAFDSLTVLYESTKVVPVLAKREDELLKQRFRERTSENKNAFYIFYDEFQTDDDSKILEFAQKIKNHIELEKNCRNTINIAKTVLSPLIEVDANYCQRKDEGEKIKFDFHEFNEEDIFFRLNNMLKTYYLEPDNTVILTFKSDCITTEYETERSILLSFPKHFVTRDGISLETVENPAEVKEIYYELDKDRRFLFTNWKKFQGLEKQNIIFVDFDHRKLFEQGNEQYIKQFYVALTRAQDKAFFLVQDGETEGSDPDEGWDAAVGLLLVKWQEYTDSLNENDFCDYNESKKFWGIYGWRDWEALRNCLAQLQNEINYNPEFKARIKDAGNDDNIFEELSSQSKIPAIILKEYSKVLDHEKVKEAEEEKNAFHKRCNTLKDDYYEIYRKYRHINRNLAICRVLNAESLDCYDNAILKAFRKLSKIGKEASKIGLSEYDFHKRVIAMFGIWGNISKLFRDMKEYFNISDLDIDIAIAIDTCNWRTFKEEGSEVLDRMIFDKNTKEIYLDLRRAQRNGLIIEALLKGWWQVDARKDADFWKNFWLVVDLLDKRDDSVIKPDDLSKLKDLKRSAMQCYLETLERFKKADLPDPGRYLERCWLIWADTAFGDEKKYFGYLSLI